MDEVKIKGAITPSIRKLSIQLTEESLAAAAVNDTYKVKQKRLEILKEELKSIQIETKKNLNKKKGLKKKYGMAQKELERLQEMKEHLIDTECSLKTELMNQNVFYETIYDELEAVNQGIELQKENMREQYQNLANSVELNKRRKAIEVLKEQIEFKKKQIASVDDLHSKVQSDFKQAVVELAEAYIKCKKSEEQFHEAPHHQKNLTQASEKRVEFILPSAERYSLFLPVLDLNKLDYEAEAYRAMCPPTPDMYMDTSYEPSLNGSVHNGSPESLQPSVSEAPADVSMEQAHQENEEMDYQSNTSYLRTNNEELVPASRPEDPQTVAAEDASSDDSIDKMYQKSPEMQMDKDVMDIGGTVSSSLPLSLQSTNQGISRGMPLFGFFEDNRTTNNGFLLNFGPDTNEPTAQAESIFNLFN